VEKPANVFQLAPDEVHSWCANLDVRPEMSDRLQSTLSPDERNRSARFRFDYDRRRFIVARGVLRDLLGRYLQTQPDRIHFVSNAFGKPGLSLEFGRRLSFNLSHSAGLAVVAIAPAVSVGVDIEQIQADAAYADIARHVFPAAEADYLTTVPKQLYAETFISSWTKKEAYLKARGGGFAALPAGGPMRTWSLYTFRPAPHYAGAIVIEGSGWRLRQWQWNTE
jgi:4'-phosphopantetheinyl transferase